MITPKANTLAELARQEKDIDKARELSRVAFDELFDNCQPTMEEFESFSHGLVLLPSVMWRMVYWVPVWDANNNESR